MKNRRLLKNMLFALVIILGGFAVFGGAATGSNGRDFIVRSFSPSGTVTDRVQIQAVFNRDVVSKDEVGESLDPTEMPFIFTPALSGEGKWTDTKTFVFTPRGGRLEAATKYTALVNPWLRDLSGRKLSGTKTFSFNSPALEFIGAKQVDFDYGNRRVNYELAFSMPVSPSRLDGYLSLYNKESSPRRTINYSLKQGPVSTSVILSIPPFNGTEAELEIARGFPPANGTLGLEKDVQLTLRPALSMVILDTNISSGTRSASINIDTSAPVDFAKADSFIEVTPETKYTIEPRSRGFSLMGDFKPQDRVTVKIKKGFPSLGGYVLENDWSRAFVFPDKEPAVAFDVAGRVITPAGSLRLPLETVNVEKAEVQVWKLYENNIPIAMRSEWQDFPMDLSKLISSKSYAVAGKPNETVRRALDLEPILDGEKGVFLVIARDEETGWRDTRTVVNVTDLGVTAKVGPESAFVWVNSIRTGEPVYGAKVTFWSWANQPVGEGKTDLRGICVADLSESDNARPVLATVSRGDDTVFVRLDNGLFQGSDEIDTSGQPWLYRGYSAFCYLPRGIFRPGEQVSFRAIVRDMAGTPPKPFPVTVKIYSPTGKVWTQQTEKLSEEGTFSVDLNFPQDVPVGTWYAYLYAPGSDSPIGQKEFFIEEFAAPRLFVDAETDRQQLIGTDSAILNISSRYAFGGTASDLPWEAEMTLRNKTFRPSDWAGYYFYDSEAQFSPESIFLGSGALDEEGKAEADVESRTWGAPSMLELVLRAGVMEEGGRWVYKTTRMDWFPREVMVGINMPSNYQVNKAFEFKAAAVTPEGKAADVSKLEYKIFRKVTQSVLYESDGRTQYRTQVQLIDRASGEIALKDGEGAVSYTPTQSGNYLVRVEDPKSGAKASYNFYVYAPYYDDEGETDSNLPDRVEITTDKELYKPGDAVRVKLKAPFAGKVLLAVETYKVVHREVREMKGSEEIEISLRANEFMMPNAWITAQVIKPAKEEDETGQMRAYGAAPLMMDNSDKKLTVEIPDIGRIEPGENEIKLTVKDAKGKGTAAEVTVMLVDETVLGLTGWTLPDPWGFFTAKRMLGMETYDLYNAIISPEDQTTQLLTAGGGGMDENAMMKQSLNPVQAQRFKILSLIQTVRTGSNGQASVKFDVPEFAGTARLTAVAVSAKALGSSDGPAQINRDVVIEPSLPRALGPDDVLTSPLSVFNMTSGDVDVKITIAPTGPIALEGEREFTLSVAAGQKESRMLAFKGTGYGVAKVLFTAEWPSGKIEDEIELPVRPAAPRVSENWSAVIETGKSEKINLTGDWFAGTKSGRVMLSAMPAISIADVAQYLITYPYGCLEQTVSSAWPLLSMPDLVAAVDPELAPEDSLKGSLIMRIQRIRGLQNYDGGFARWQGQGWSQLWDSLYATHFLLEAQKKGFEIPAENMSAALSYVRRILTMAPASDNDWAWKEALTRRAYACFVLAIAGENQLGWMSNLKDREKELPPSARLFLAAAYGAAGQKADAESILGQNLEAIRMIPGGNDNYDSNLRNKALQLLAWTYADPSSPSAASVAFALIDSFKSARYYNTQEGGFTTLALARYFAAQPAEGEPAGEIKDSTGKTLASVSVKERTAALNIGENDAFTMENSGKARLFAASTISGVPTKPVQPVDSGIEIRQVLKDRTDDIITDRVHQGEALTATVSIKPTAGTLKNIIAVIPLPAGLEVENPRLTGGEGELPYNARVELRDDRIILFADVISSTLKWDFTLRAVTAGTFVVPQISAECMYDPAVQSINGGGTLEIIRGVAEDEEPQG